MFPQQLRKAEVAPAHSPARMPFTSATLSFRALTYTNRHEPMAIREQLIDLERQADGSYEVPLDKVLVKVHSASLNPVDTIFYNSAYWFAKYINKDRGVGHDYSGTVASIGTDAARTTGFKVGDKVNGMFFNIFGKGSAAEYVLIDPTAKDDLAISRVPMNLDLVEASTWPLVYGTANNMFASIPKVIPGAKVLVLGGATSVGRYVIQLAKNVHGATEIVSTNSSGSDAIVKELGATKNIDYTRHQSILNPVLESVKETGEFDYIFDCCGGYDLFPQIDHVIKKNGYYITAVGDKKPTFKSIDVFSMIISNFYSTFRATLSKLSLLNYYFIFLPSMPGPWIHEGVKHLEDGSVRVFIDSTHRFEDFQKAFDIMNSNKARGKVVLRVSGE